MAHRPGGLGPQRHLTNPGDCVVVVARSLAELAESPTDSRAVGEMAGIAIGGVVALLSLFGGPISGAGMNPARSVGPALVEGHMDLMWIYTLGPITGAVLGAFAYQLIRCGDQGGKAQGCC